MSVAMTSAAANSSMRSYRLAWTIWVVVSLLDGAIYCHILRVDGADPRSMRLAFLFLLQAIWLPIYFSKKTFESAVEAVIRSAAAAMTFAGMTSFFLGAIAQLLGMPVLTSKDPRLQFGYVSSVLLLNAITAGMVLGMLRWRIIRERPTQPAPQPVDIELDRKLRSIAIWIASATLSFWLFHAYVWATANSPVSTSLTAPVSLLPGSATASAALGRLPGIVGLFLISPIPFLLSPRDAASRGNQILKYALSAFAAGFGVSVIVSLPMLTWAPIVFPYILPSFCVPALLWGVLYGSSLQPSSKSASPSEKRYSPYYPHRPRLLISGPVWCGVAGYAFALLVGWLATTPVALGFHGAGCRDVFQMGSAEYWFWKEYKGFSSEVNTAEGRVVRLSIDPSICMTLDVVSLDRLKAPEARWGGYVVAARIWSWLIDPEEWQSERTVHFRKELNRLIGQDFSSYDELQAWWQQNGEYLAWSVSGEKLEVRRPDSPSNGDQGISSHTYVPASASESVRQSPWLFGPDPIRGHPSFPGFNSLFLDREARLRALKLYATDIVQVLTGERDRRVREYLRNLTGGDFATQRDWWDYFYRLPLPPCSDLPCPPGISELSDVYVRTPPDPNLWNPGFQQEALQIIRSRHDDFLPWLQRPENKPFLQWVKADYLILEISDIRRNTDPVSQRSVAMDRLRNMTHQSFDSSEKWVQWWRENRSNLILSEDGLKLVVKQR